MTAEIETRLFIIAALDESCILLYMAITYKLRVAIQNLFDNSRFFNI